MLLNFHQFSLNACVFVVLSLREGEREKNLTKRLFANVSFCKNKKKKKKKFSVFLFSRLVIEKEISIFIFFISAHKYRN